MRNPDARIESESPWDDKRKVEKKQGICEKLKNKQHFSLVIQLFLFLKNTIWAPMLFASICFRFFLSKSHQCNFAFIKISKTQKKINSINGFLLYKIFSKNKNILIFWSKNPYVKHFEILWKIKINIIYPSVFALEKYEVIWTKTIESWGNALTRMS